MDKFRFQQSFELLIFCVRNSQKSDHHTLDSIKKLAQKLDFEFSCQDFTKLLSVENDQNPQHSENLFIDLNKIEFKFTNLQLLTKAQAVFIYTCICGWLNTPESDFDRTILTRLLSLEVGYKQILDSFLSVELRIDSDSGNEIFELIPHAESGDELEGNWVDSNKPERIILENQFLFSGLPTPVKVLYLEDLKIFLLKPADKKSDFKKNGEKSPCHWVDLQVGDRIEIGPDFSLDFYSLKSRYLNHKWGKKMWIEIKNLAFTYPNGRGIKEFSLSLESGRLVGLLGNEGCGKSTLLEILAGHLAYSRGTIRINGYNLRKNLYQLKNVIGYVSDQDLLYNELSVYENLYLTAKLYLGKKTDEEIIVKVNKLLKDLDLEHLKRTVVGSIPDKNLLPGQRRMLNIALELVREPHILIVDNSLAPISTNDASRIIEVLSDYTYQGKIVITSITQTNPEAFLKFDRLFILDDGGFPVYYGNSIDCAPYLNNIYDLKPMPLSFSGADEILQFLNQRVINRTMVSQDRYKSPLHLYRKFVDNFPLKNGGDVKKRRSLPENILHTPTLERQYSIFTLRDIKTKLARTRELIYTVLVSPMLALIVATFLHETPQNDYSFQTNPHIPQFYFISLVLAIFMGLIQSSNEIFRERNIYKKQEYLNLSRFSYVNSKLSLLFIICLVQSVLFVSISVYILEIKNSVLVFGAVFFSSQAFGVLLGLLFSASQNSLEHIYTRSIPLVIILQLLFGGGFIDLSSYTYKSSNYTPVFADLMVARWGYECVMVDQYMNNPYMDVFYESYRNRSQSEFYATELLPILRERIENINTVTSDYDESTRSTLRIVSNYLERIPVHFDAFPYGNVDLLNPEDFTADIQSDLLEHIEYLIIYFFDRLDNAVNTEDELIARLTDSLGSEHVNMLRSKYINKAVSEKVRRSNVPEEVKYVNEKPIQNQDNIFQLPLSNWGKSAIFLPRKQFGAQLIDTVEFNLSVIWMINLMLYIILVSNVILRIAGKQRL